MHVPFKTLQMILNGQTVGGLRTTRESIYILNAKTQYNSRPCMNNPILFCLICFCRNIRPLFQTDQKEEGGRIITESNP